MILYEISEISASQKLELYKSKIEKSQNCVLIYNIHIFY